MPASAGTAREGIDVGVVTASPEPMLRFYRDVLGLEPLGRLATSGGSTVEQLGWGRSILKIVTLAQGPAAPVIPGGVPAAAGYRYLTLRVGDVDEVLARCASAGVPLVVPVTEIPDGSQIAIVTDPDGNWVELMRRPSDA